MPRALLASTTIAACLLFAASAHARPTLDGERLTQLSRYEVLEFGDPFKNGIERGKAIGVIDATPEEVFRVATDYGKWREFMPRVRGSRVHEESRDQATVEITAELPWPAGRNVVTARYLHERLPGEIFRVRFDMLRGTMKQYLGSLYIEPWSPGQSAKSALTYELVAQPDVLAPRSSINRVVRRSASGFVHALRQRINQLHLLGLLHPLPPPSPPRPPLALPDEHDLKARR
jgi:hypothetical protein